MTNQPVPHRVVIEGISKYAHFTVRVAVDLTREEIELIRMRRAAQRPGRYPLL